MNGSPRFLIRILSQSHCELRSEDEHWSKKFVSVKGALEFVEGVKGGRVTIKDETVGSGGNCVRQTSFLHVE